MVGCASKTTPLSLRLCGRDGLGQDSYPQSPATMNMIWIGFEHVLDSIGLNQHVIVWSNLIPEITTAYSNDGPGVSVFLAKGSCVERVWDFYSFIAPGPFVLVDVFDQFHGCLDLFHENGWVSVIQPRHSSQRGHPVTRVIARLISHWLAKAKEVGPSHLWEIQDDS